MRRAIITILALGCAGPALAETCEETFVRVFTDRAPKGPIKIHITQQMKGAKPTRNINYQTGTGDWMTEMVDPANMPWTLVTGDVMYVSSDKGQSWKKLRAVDTAQNTQGMLDDMKAAANAARNVTCGQEEVDGVAYTTVQADYALPKLKSEHTDKFWINAETGWLAKSETLTRMSGIEVTATQVIEKAPGLTLPTPH